jgi:hypothetical protein
MPTPKTLALNALLNVALGLVYFSAIMGLFALLFGFSL